MGCRCLDLDQEGQSVTGLVAGRLRLEGRRRVGAVANVWIVTMNSIQQQVGSLASSGWTVEEGAAGGR